MRTETRPSSKHLLLILVVAVVAAAAPASASASTTLDVRGTFDAQGQGGGPYTITLTDENCSTGVVSGTATGGVGPENGTLNGNQLTLHEAYGGYTSDITATVSADTSSISGTFHDSNNLTAPWNATRTSGPPASPRLDALPAPAPAPAEPDPDAGSDARAVPWGAAPNHHSGHLQLRGAHVDRHLHGHGRGHRRPGLDEPHG